MPRRLLEKFGLVRVFVAAAILVGGLCSPLGAQDFRVDTEVFLGDEKEPFAHTLTLFADGLVYDFLPATDSREVTIFDPRMQNFTLLDKERKLKTIITVQEVMESCISLNAHARESKDPFFAFAVDPKFDVTEEETKLRSQPATQLTLKSDWLVYTSVGTKPEQATTALAYRNFADAHNRLNALRPGGMLPAPREKLNEELGNRGLVPATVTRVILPQNRFQKKLEVRSEHLYNWSLSRLDRDRIDEVGGWRVSYESVPFDRYREIQNEAKPQQQAKR